MSAPRFYVAVDRDDGSRTYKGPWVFAHAARERDAWRHAFPAYDTRCVPAPHPADTAEEAAAAVLVRSDVRRWTRVTRTGGRYFPTPTTEETVNR